MIVSPVHLKMGGSNTSVCRLVDGAKASGSGHSGGGGSSTCEDEAYLWRCFRAMTTLTHIALAPST